jgi:hypothetical protein
MSLKQTHLNGELKPFHYRDNVKIVGKEEDLKQCTDCNRRIIT